MSQTLTALSAALPVAAGWSLHSLRLRRRIEAARRDPLTGLLTRDAFAERATRMLARRSGAVYVIDLDRFKEINDTHGHAAGDAVLRVTGQRLSRWADEYEGVVVRLGGDEFAAVGRVFSREDLVWTLNQLTNWLEAPIEAEGHTFSVGASIGAVDHDPASGTADVSALLRLADEQMYRAKRGGAPWLNALSRTPERATVNGRRAGRRGTGDAA
ncbi:GGDEF domain-containing protein [Streptomyces sp. WAC06614]|uniref:GGDEF domain-containing protein n=1 Tax=Streptomyces sp. WAC06614 TaxID=2487416 RepID=UPI000F766209|nr:GGDEF domain-containing protein [Streptomyces sp. WAC06614]RSS79488.1 GGDEF domain-containing protein [Streptomyces sp. WAC06614]